MKDTCETDAKKLARCRIWSRFELPQEGKIAILAGPENGDARHLRARGLDPSRLVCVDANPEALRKARRVEPLATYAAGDFLETLSTTPCAGFFLDEVRWVSPEAADYLAECASLVPLGAPIAAAYTYAVRRPRSASDSLRPPSREAREHWSDFFQKECRRAFEARGLMFEVISTVAYIGKGYPMIAFVGRVTYPRPVRKVRVIKIESRPEFTAELVRRQAVTATRNQDLAVVADHYNLPAQKLRRWVEDSRKASQSDPDLIQYWRERRKRLMADPEAAENERARKRRYYAENKDIISKNRKAFRAANLEAIREQERTRQARKREENREEVLKKQREWYAKPENRERTKANVAAYKAKKAAEAEFYKTIQVLA